MLQFLNAFYSIDCYWYRLTFQDKWWFTSHTLQCSQSTSKKSLFPPTGTCTTCFKSCFDSPAIPFKQKTPTQSLHNHSLRFSPQKHLIQHLLPGGYRVPKGFVVSADPRISNRDPKLHTEPVTWGSPEVSFRFGGPDRWGRWAFSVFSVLFCYVLSWLSWSWIQLFRAVES